MIDGILNQLLFLYQKDIIGKYSVSMVSMMVWSSDVSTMPLCCGMIEPPSAIVSRLFFLLVLQGIGHHVPQCGA